MMYQKPSKRWLMLKALCAIPVAALTVCAFATPSETDPVEDFVATLENKEVPVFNEPLTELLTTEATPAELSEMLDDTPFAIHPVADQYGRILSFTHEGKPADGYFECTAEYVFIDGRQATEAELRNYKTLLANSKFEMLKNANGTAKYDYKDKHGIIVIHTQEASTAQDGDTPLFVVDGKIVKVDISPRGKDINLMKDEELHKIFNIKEEDIESITVLKDGAATAIYGEKGKNGVIEIKTKAAQQPDDDPVLNTCDEPAQYPGGQGALMQFLAQNLRYPKVAMENGIQGRIIVQFIIEKDGSCSNFTLVRSADDFKSPENGITVIAPNDPEAATKAQQQAESRQALNEEALRVCHLMPKWEPAKNKGKLVRMRYTLPITFRLQ